MGVSKQENVIDAIASTDTETVPTSSIFTSPDKSSCLSLSSTEWDIRNGTFTYDFISSDAPTNFNFLTHSNILEYDAFTVTWRPLPDRRSLERPAVSKYF